VPGYTPPVIGGPIALGTAGSVLFVDPAGLFAQDNAGFSFNATTDTLTLGGPLVSTGATLSGLTAGSVLFAGIGGLISQDNSNLFWDDANNRLGIGTNAPAAALDLNGGALMAGAATLSGTFAHSGTNFGIFGVTPAVRPPAYTVTNAGTDRSYNANAYTMDELADVLGTLIADLKTLGILQ
jgi:hypothetical protein